MVEHLVDNLLLNTCRDQIPMRCKLDIDLKEENWKIYSAISNVTSEHVQIKRFL